MHKGLKPPCSRLASLTPIRSNSPIHKRVHFPRSRGEGETMTLWLDLTWSNKNSDALRSLLSKKGSYCGHLFSLGPLSCPRHGVLSLCSSLPRYQISSCTFSTDAGLQDFSMYVEVKETKPEGNFPAELTWDERSKGDFALLISPY